MKQRKRTMFYALQFLSFALLFFYSSFSLAITCSVDFSSPKSYVDSLNKIRERIGIRLPNLTTSQGNMSISVFVLSPSASNIGIIVTLQGIDYDDPNTSVPIRLVLSPENLYLAGFIQGNTFYRFRDRQNTVLPSDIHVQIVDLTTGSDYTELERVGDVRRDRLQINRHSLVTSYRDLNQFSGTALNQASARAMLRFITVLPEALRFRQIQRNFRPVLSQTASNSHYIMSPSNISLTLNWGGLSATLPSYSPDSTQVQVGNIRLNGLTEILYAVALLLDCYHRPKTNVYAQCSMADPIVINKVIWDKKTLSTILSE